MIKTDENALICDLAQTYNIYDYKQLPLMSVAVFACGLKSDSRIKMKMAGQKVPVNTLLLASICDTLKMLLWTKTKDAKYNRNRPKSILNIINDVKKDEIIGFHSSEDFLKARYKEVR
ncbi:DUF5361 domain-containing protein [Peptoanaerobacter stomatis]|uniref:DUF5361 domain-containing protein n=1 Tax=Peptoanaerobacter stomatis TaxID=796937 RepID=UPI003FA0DE78